MMKVLCGILIFVVTLALFFVVGYYGTHGVLWFVNWVGVNNFAIFSGVVSTIQGAGVLANSRMDYGR